MSLRKIVCYSRNCNKPAQWKVPGHPVLYLCTSCFKKLFPKIPLPERVEVGPTEFKEEHHEQST